MSAFQSLGSQLGYRRDGALRGFAVHRGVNSPRMDHRLISSSKVYDSKLEKKKSESQSPHTRNISRLPLTLLLAPYASLWPSQSHARQCSSSSSVSELVLGLSHPGCGIRLQLALGMTCSPTFHIKMRPAVAPAMNAPSGVNASPTMGESIVRKHRAFLSALRAFQMSIAQSSPPLARSRSSSGVGASAGSGCHCSAVIVPECAEIDCRCPVSSHSWRAMKH